MRKIPPLNALKAFDAVARNGSFSKAAIELCVSASAVSQQIALLENWMNIKFIERSSNKTILTTEGRQFSRKINSLFDDLESSVLQTRNIPHKDEIRVSILPSLAARWFISRLPNFSKMHPNTRVMVEASFDVIDFNQEEFSLAIRSGMGSYPECYSNKIFDEYVTPVCSPDYWENNPTSLGSIGACALLADCTFEYEDTNLNWNTWMSRENIRSSVRLNTRQQFTDSNLTIQAAVNGGGFMLGRSVLIGDEILRGTLIEPFKNKQISDWSYYLVYPSNNHPPRYPLHEFIDWLKSEAEQTFGIIE